MQIFIAENSGFCFGVKRAIENSEKVLESGIKTITTGDIIHNHQEVNRLRDMGLVIDSNPKEVQEDTNLIIRAHGESLNKRKEYNRLGYNVVDCTCPVLLNIYKQIQKAEEDGYTIVIIGNKDHPEIIAMAGHLKNRPIIVNSKEEAKEIKNLKKPLHRECDFV